MPHLARLKAPKHGPLTAEFFQPIAAINLLAEAQPGFVWRLVGEVREHTPTLAEAKQKLECLRQKGPTLEALDLQKVFELRVHSPLTPL